MSVRRTLAATLLAWPLAIGQIAGARADAAAGGKSTPMLAVTDGGAVYQHVCQGCHMPNGRGATGAGTIPALAGNDKLEASGYPIYVVLHGLGGMPAVGWTLDDKQVAAVVSYVRTSWGNHWTDPVTAADVTPSRPTVDYKPGE